MNCNRLQIVRAGMIFILALYVMGLSSCIPAQHGRFSGDDVGPWTYKLCKITCHDSDGDLFFTGEGCGVQIILENNHTMFTSTQTSGKSIYFRDIDGNLQFITFPNNYAVSIITIGTVTCEKRLRIATYRGFSPGPVPTYIQHVANGLDHEKEPNQ